MHLEETKLLFSDPHIVLCGSIFYCCTIFNSGNTMWAHPRDSNIISKRVTIILLYFFLNLFQKRICVAACGV